MLVDRHESRTPGVFFTAFWRYKPYHGGLGALLICLAVLLLVRLLMLMFQEEVIPPERIHEAIATGVTAFLMLYAGTTLLFSLITGYSVRLTISEEGVRYGTGFFPWRRIRWIDARQRRGNVQIFMVLGSGLRAQRWLTVDDGLSQEQWERLIKAVETRVSPRFPHLRIGDAMHSSLAYRPASPGPMPGTVNAP